ncbi:MAG: polysaccharide deacetylase family protein [Oscillospiraceae bacterium]|nr:polysaccharide deacetylase family protein [Oscillospiraceae bacterium]
MGLTDSKKILLRHKSVLSALTLILAVVLIFWTVSNPAIVGVSASKRQLPVYCVQRDDKVVALSFDAAWGNEDTQTLIDILNKYNINTTFFVVGDWVDRYPESVQALHENGNEIMNHSTDHAHFSSLSTEQIVSDLQACNKKIEEITGVSPTLFRCPYGEYDDHVINAVNSIGMTAVQWDVDSLDWKGLSADEIEQRVLDRVQPGSIVLFHNAAENTPQALPGIIESLLADGYTIVPISQILLSGEYIIDNNGRQCPK